MPKSKSLMRKSIIQGTQEFFTCFECGKTFRNATAMRLHNKATHGVNHGCPTELNFYCTPCDTEVKNKFQFNQHIEKIHKGCWKATCPQK